VYSLTFSGLNIFAGTSGGSGIYFSSNFGLNWMQVNNGLTNLEINALAVSGTNLFAGTGGGGVFLSTNSGVSWNSVNNGLTDQYISELLISGTRLVAGTLNGVFLSTNNGTNWTS
jgi:hypothetical protein